MKIPFPSRPANAGFTLVELMVSMALLGMMTVALLSSHLLGLRMFNISATKLGASEGARKALSRVRDDIRTAKMLYVGTGDASAFTRADLGDPREGNALQIYPTASTNTFVRYYLDADSQALCRVASAAATPEIIANFITNTVPFRAEDYAGNVLTTDFNNRIVLMQLDFYQWQFPVASAGVGAFYDYYHLQTRMTRRTIE